MNFENWWLYVIGPTVGALTGSFGTWIFQKRRNKIDDINAATDTFNKVNESLELRINKMLEEQEKSNLKIEELTKQVAALSAQIETLKNQVKEKERLQKKVVHLEKILTDNNIPFN